MEDSARTSDSTNRKCVAVVGPANPYRGGIAHFTNRWSQSLSATCDVTLLTFSRQYPSLLFPGKSQTESAMWDLPSKPVRLIDSMRPGTWRKAGRFLSEAQPDVVVLCYWLPFFVPAYLSVLRAFRRHAAKKAQVILLLHNVSPHGRFPFGDALLRRLIESSDGFITLSEASTKALRDRKPDAKILTAFHPIYDMFSAVLPPALARRELSLPEKKTLLFFGLIRRYKGLDVLIEAMPSILEKHDVQLLVAGEFYEDEVQIRRRIVELGLMDTIRIENAYIPNDKVHLYYSAADLVVQPYRSATQSGVTNIALHFGKPVVVTNVGGLPETVPDGQAGFVVPPEDPDSLSDAVDRYLMSDPEELAHGARIQAASLSWNRFTKLFLDFIGKPGPGRSR